MCVSRQTCTRLLHAYLSEEDVCLGGLITLVPIRFLSLQEGEAFAVACIHPAVEGLQQHANIYRRTKS